MSFLRGLEKHTEMNFQKIILFYCTCILPTILIAQIDINGIVLDAHSGEPIPFANVVLVEDLSIGATTDYEGQFSLSLSTQADSLQASALGYETVRIPYEKKDRLIFQLNATSYEMSEIVVKAEEDPAVAFMRKVFQQKAQNNPAKIPTYQCEVYNKLELDLVGITERFRDLKIIRPFEFVFENVDSVSEDKPFLPLFLSESISDYYYRLSPKAKKEVIKASKVSGIQNESISQVTGRMYQDFNVYDNWITILNSEFVSPLSENGLFYYRYYMVDSAFIDNKWCYQIQYYPKAKNFNSFFGDIWVNDSSYAVKRANLQMNEDVKLNYVTQLSLLQDFELLADSVWVLKKDFITVSFEKINEPLLGVNMIKFIAENAPNVQGKKTTTYKHYSFEEKEVERLKSDIEVSEEVFNKDDAFWEERRHVPLSSNEEKVYELIDTIQGLKVIDRWKKLSTYLFTGYVGIGPIEVGSFYGIYNNNHIEGARFRLGARTGIKLSDRFMVGGYAAYGLKDKRYKYGANFLYLLSKKPRQSISGSYIDDIQFSVFTEAEFNTPARGLASSYWFRRRRIPFKLLGVKALQLDYFKEWNSGFSTNISIQNRRLDPYFNFYYKTTEDDIYEPAIIDAFDQLEIGVKLRFAHQEKFLSGVFNRMSLGSPKPIVSLEYKLGIKNWLNSGFDYHKLELLFTDKVKLYPLGHTQLDILGGKIWGTLPYLLLKIPQGNEGIMANYNGFNLINEFEFAMDTYGMLFLDHHFDGLLLHNIGIFRKWKIRSVANFRMMMGSMNAANRAANEMNLFENTILEDEVRVVVPDERPYMEGGVGVENIFRFLRLDAMWKLSYHRPDAPDWGIRANFHFKF